MPARQWFISDLHLSEQRPGTVELFTAFIDSAPQPGDRLFILGDLFDAWIGDDDDADLADTVRKTLRAVSDREVSVAIQRGNRDFLMGRRLMRACGAELLPDCYRCSVAGKPALLMHGDLLCTDDIPYQKARRRFRNPLFQWFMLAKPLASRRRIAAEYRRRSGQETALKPANIMDVNDDTVIDYLRRNNVELLIHGHTHRPAWHQHVCPDGRTADRLVLPEWHEDHAAAWVDDGQTLQAYPLKP